MLHLAGNEMHTGGIVFVNLPHQKSMLSATEKSMLSGLRLFLVARRVWRPGAGQLVELLDTLPQPQLALVNCRGRVRDARLAPGLALAFLLGGKRAAKLFLALPGIGQGLFEFGDPGRVAPVIAGFGGQQPVAVAVDFREALGGLPPGFVALGAKPLGKFGVFDAEPRPLGLQFGDGRGHLALHAARPHPHRGGPHQAQEKQRKEARQGKPQHQQQGRFSLQHHASGDGMVLADRAAKGQTLAGQNGFQFGLLEYLR
jgi:hypothetical protein